MDDKGSIINAYRDYANQGEKIDQLKDKIKKGKDMKIWNTNGQWISFIKQINFTSK